MDKRELRYVGIMAGVIVVVIVAGLVLMIVQTAQKQRSENHRETVETMPSPSSDSTLTYQQQQEETAMSAAENRRARLLEEFDLSNLSIELENIHHGGPGKDGIKALVNPRRIPIAETSELTGSMRVIEVAIGDVHIAYPIDILIAHEIVNDVVEGVPIAVIYCPLCDSASVVDRRIHEDGAVLEFGVSGLLMNSNVLMYDRTDDALWTQLGFQAISGLRAGTMLESLPIQVRTLEEFRDNFPDGETLASIQQRDQPLYASARGAYTSYFESDTVSFPVEHTNEALPAKTLGLGMLVGERAFFTSMKGAEGTIRIDTDLGSVTLQRTETQLLVIEQPAGIHVAQTFFYAWVAFHPHVEIVDVATSID